MSNKQVKRILEGARELIRHKDKIRELLEGVIDKSGKINISEGQAFLAQLRLMVRMIRSHFQGEYRALSSQTILMLVFGLLYFVTPTDLMPDFIPALGLTDDISVIYMLLKSFSEDIRQYRAWETHRQ